MWQWVPGIFSGSEVAPNVRAVSLLEKSDWTRGVQADDFGPYFQQRTLLLPQDGEVLAHLQGGAPGLAVKAQDGWTSMFLSIPNLPPTLVRDIVQRAGVHQYAQSDDIVTAGQGFVMLHARAGGRKTLRFPQSVAVWDALQNKRLAASTRAYSFTVEDGETTVEDGETRLFALK